MEDIVYKAMMRNAISSLSCGSPNENWHQGVDTNAKVKRQEKRMDGPAEYFLPSL